MTIKKEKSVAPGLNPVGRYMKNLHTFCDGFIKAAKQVSISSPAGKTNVNPENIVDQIINSLDRVPCKCVAFMFSGGENRKTDRRPRKSPS